MCEELFFLFIFPKLYIIDFQMYLSRKFVQTSTDPRNKDVTVVAFIIYPAASNSFNVESLKGQAVCKQLHNTVSRIKDNLASRMFEGCLRFVHNFR